MAIQPYPKAYPNGWEDLPSTASPFTAAAMNTIDGGVKANRDLLIANELNFLSAVPTGATTLSLLKGMGANTERHYYTNTALSDFPTSDNDLWYLQFYKVDSSNLSYSDIILRDKTTGKNYVGTASNSAITWHEVGSGEGNAVLVELTWAEYQALSPAEKMNGNLYAITDHDTSVPTTMAASNVSFNKTNTSLNAVTAQDGIFESSKARDMLAKVEKTGHATEPYTAGQYVVSNNAFRKVTSAIASGNTISNTNSQETTVGAEFSRINADLSDKVKFIDVSLTVGSSSSYDGKYWVNSDILSISLSKIISVFVLSPTANNPCFANVLGGGENARIRLWSFYPNVSATVRVAYFN